MLLLLLGWTMGTYWSWMVWPNRSMCIEPPPSCKLPGSTSRADGLHSTPRLVDLCGLDHRVCKVCPGWVPAQEVSPFGVVIPLAGSRCVPRTSVRLDCPLEVALASGVVVSVPASLLGCEPLLLEGERAGLGLDEGGCRSAVDHPNGGIRNCHSGVKKKATNCHTHHTTTYHNTPQHTRHQAQQRRRRRSHTITTTTPQRNGSGNAPQQGPKCIGLWHTNQQSGPRNLSCYSMLTG